MSLQHPFVLLLAIPVIAIVLWTWQSGYLNLPRRRRTMALVVRLIIITALLLGLAGPRLRLPQGREAVVFVADLSASDLGDRSSMQSFINGALQSRPADDVAGVVSAGGNALVEQPAVPLSSFDGFQSHVNPDYTNLESGMELGAAILPGTYRRRIVLLSDGQQNVGDALSAARVLRAEGIRVDVAPQRVPGGADVRVDGVNVPSELRTSERFPLSVALHSTVTTTARLDVYRDQTLVLDRQETVFTGDNHFVFDQPPLTPGFHTYRVQVTPAIDSQPENNTGSAFTFVQGPPRVLVITESTKEARNVVGALRTAGMALDERAPSQVAPSLSNLQRYAGVVIVNTAAPFLGPDLMSQLVPYVRDLGRGLVVIGGQESFGLGGYGQTPLEEALPVKMDVPKRKDIPAAAVVLIIETLEEATRVNISKEAGKAVVSLLNEQDWVAVNDTPTDGTSGWAVPLQHVRNKAAMGQAIDLMQPGDPNTYLPTLQEAAHVLRSTKAPVKHIILLGDGDAIDPGYQRVVRTIHDAGITVSTIITGGLAPSDFDTMRNIARWGGGRYYRADDPNVIPRVFLREAQTVARSGIVQGKFLPEKLSANPMLRDLRRIPPLYGYVATAAKPTSELELVSQKLDPLLTSWQFGSGRAVAWTSDAAGLWTRDWLSAPGANRFWADVVSWTLPSDAGHRLYVTTTSSQGEGHVSVDIPPALGLNPTVTGKVVGPNLQTTTVRLQPSVPGRYQGAFPAPSEGAYIVNVEARGAGHADAGQAGLDVSYPAEYRTSGTDMPFLRQLARAGGGSLVTNPSSAWLENLSGASESRSLADLLWLIALLLLPIDIGLRRLLVRRRDLSRLAAAVASLAKQSREGRQHPVAPGVGAAYSRRPLNRSTPEAALQAGAGVSQARRADVPRMSGPEAEPMPVQPGTSAGFDRMKPFRPAARIGSSRGRPGRPPAQAAPSEDTTVGKLLAAKRRRG